MGYKIITDATVEPVTLIEARAHLRVDAYGSPLAHPDDDYITALISYARDFCEQHTRRTLAEKVVEFAYDDFPTNEIEISLFPISSITSIKYIDIDSLEQTVLDTVYALDDYTTPNWVFLKAEQEWPVTLETENNVKIRIVVGQTPVQVAPAIKAAILLMVGSLYENRQEDLLSAARISFNSLPTGVYSLLQPYRLGMGL